MSDQAPAHPPAYGAEGDGLRDDPPAYTEGPRLPKYEHEIRQPPRVYQNPGGVGRQDVELAVWDRSLGRYRLPGQSPEDAGQTELATDNGAMNRRNLIRRPRLKSWCCLIWVLAAVAVPIALITAVRIAA